MHMSAYSKQVEINFELASTYVYPNTHYVPSLPSLCVRARACEYAYISEKIT